MKYKEEGFTLIEILAVIIIVGILASMATASMFKLRSKAQDTKRLSDMRQIQYALDRYASDHGGQYPSDSEFIPGGSLVSRNGHVVYMESVPHNPLPQTGGDCPNTDYQYFQGIDGLSYNLTYCLSNKMKNLEPGICVAMPSLLCAPGNCSCTDIKKTCCGWCAPEATCIHTP
jgi:prepilin-type N-terminal cleavage/methylation domain-containing protein